MTNGEDDMRRAIIATVAASAMAWLFTACDQAPGDSGAAQSVAAASAPPQPAPVAASEKSMAMPAPRMAPPPYQASHVKGGGGGALPAPAPIPQGTWAGRESFPERAVNRWQSAQEQPVSTFAANVDTGSYAFVRRMLREGRLPPAEAVRVEEMINYFPYAHPRPEDRAEPFRPTITVLPSPWTKGAKLVHIGVKTWDVARQTRPRANLTFLIDVSGSMQPADRLPLIKQALHLLEEGLRPDDTVSIVTYANGVSIPLPPTPGTKKADIMAAIDALTADGGTNGGEGLRTAYAQAEKNFDAEAVNRIILATDGDFNVGDTDPKRLQEMIAAKRKKGIALSVVGVGTGNLNDALMQRLAHAGSGQAAYLDSLLEARKFWIEELSASLVPVADDAKFQVEFNPGKAAEYRLIGYETRQLQRADFNDDAIPAGQIGAGHSLTVLYEVLPVGVPGRHVDPLRYQKPAPATSSDELAFLRLRYKPPGQADSRLIERPIEATDTLSGLDAANDDVRFAVAVAGFGQLLARDTALAKWSWDDAATLADGARGADPYGWRVELVQLIRTAKGLAR
jgi:Ca-activated chloride channel family protein